MTDAQDNEQTAGDVDPQEQPGTAADQAGIVDQQAVVVEALNEEAEDEEAGDEEAGDE